MSSVHSDRLERWLGTETVEKLSHDMRGWYGPPIALSQVPGKVYATGDGDFIGKIEGGQHAGQFEYYLEKYYKWLNKLYTSSKSTLNMAGFASISELISAATVAGKRQELLFLKSGTTGVTAGTNSLFRVGSQPASGVSSASAPNGTICGSGTRGGLVFTAPTGGATLHFVSANVISTVASQTLLLYDRLFSVAKTMSSSATEAVTGVPTRYQNTTADTVDTAEGNFLFIEVNSALSATSHNWTTCTYVNQLGVSGQTLPSVAGITSAIVNRLDMPTGQWFAPLAAGDKGIKNLTQIQCSSAALTGGIDFVIGHPLAWISVPIINCLTIVDGVNGAFGLTRIFDNSCLAFLEVGKSTTTATTYTGSIVCVAG